MKKIVFLDIQNTILPMVKVLTAEQLCMLKYINEHYHLFLCSSVFASDIEYFNQINGLNLNYIANSGAVLKYNGDIYTAPFKADLSAIENYKNDVVFLFYEENGNFFIYNYEERLKSLYPISPKQTTIIKDFKAFKKQDFTEILYCINKNSTGLASLYKRPEINLKIIGEDHTKIFYRILKKQVNKGYFVSKVLNLLNASISQTIAAGDGAEDLALFQQAHTKIAPANAEDDIKNKADVIVPNYLENGVLKYLVNNA